MRSSALVDHLRKIAGRDAVLDRSEDLMLYEYDAGVRKSTPSAVVFPQTTAQVSQIMRWPLPKVSRLCRAERAQV